VLTRLVEAIGSFTPSDARVFSEYIFPALSDRARDESELVRLSLAECLARLASTSKRFLELAQFQRVQMSAAKKEVLVDGSYDADQRALHDLVEKLMARLADSSEFDLTIKRALVAQVYHLCLFFGRERTNEFVLPWLISVVSCNTPISIFL